MRVICIGCFSPLSRVRVTAEAFARGAVSPGRARLLKARQTLFFGGRGGFAGTISAQEPEPTMIGRIVIENYKSIESLTLDLGRVTVLVGANGSGKSNILEAIALCSAAAAKNWTTSSCLRGGFGYRTTHDTCDPHFLKMRRIK